MSANVEAQGRRDEKYLIHVNNNDNTDYYLMTI